MPSVVWTVLGTTDGTPTVDTTAHTSTTLRGAIDNAASGDSIQFTAGLTGSINISYTGGGQGTLTLSKDLTIDGSGASITIDGGHNVQVFSTSTFTVTLNHLIIANGYSSGYGGAIWNQGALTITDCTFTGSKAEGYGGAVGSRYGSLVISNSTFTDNQGFGAVFSDYRDGVGNTLSVTNSTIANNTGAGIFTLYATTVTGSTIANNTGYGLVGYGAITLTNTLLAQNAYGDYEGGRADSSSANNLIQVDNGSGLGGTNNNIVGPDVTFVGLDPNGLQDNGGWTKTIALVPGSQAIDAGKSGTGIPTQDQRGIDRVGSTDIGAFESRGFNIAVTGGNDQSTGHDMQFVQPLTVTVTPNAVGEPVAGGQVKFTPPSSGPSAAFTGSPATIAGDGTASATAVANSSQGTYTVSASAAGATSVNFNLTNTSAVFHVNAVSTAPNPDGSTWDNAYSSLQTALGLAQAGDEIWVEQGTYQPTSGADRTIAFNLKSGVGIYGGFAGTETARDQRDPAVNATILTGDIGTPGSIADNSYHVVFGSNVDSTAVLDGFTITGGNANSAAPYYDGGGIYLTHSSATLSHLTVSGNYARYEGGGIANEFGSAPTITDVTVTGNTAYDDGGGIANQAGSNATLVNVTIAGNSAAFYGGGMNNFDSSPTLINVTITDNTAPVDGGGIVSWGTSLPTLLNCIVWGNSTPGGQIKGSASATYSDIQGGWAGTGNIDADPLLDVLRNNGGSTETIALLPGSAAIDAGTTGPEVPSTDQRGIDRIAPDMGAFESRGFNIGVSGGDGQTAPINSPFTLPLQVTVTSPYDEPVVGGQVTFTAPSSGPSAAFSGSPATILPGGAASVSATANSEMGQYSVSAGANGISGSANFSLNNQEQPGLMVTTLTDENNPDDGTISLREALAYNEYLGGGNTVTFDPTLSGAINLNPYEVSGAQGTLNIYANVIIQGPTDNSITIEGGSNPYPDNGDNVEVFNIISGLTVEMNHLVIANGYSSDGGGIYNDGSTLTLRNSTITGNSGDGSGGGIFNYFGTLNIENSAITNNYAYYGGGGIASSGVLNVSNSTIAGNSTYGYGGGIANSGEATLTNSTLRGNSGWSVGGIANDGTMTVDNSTFDSNVATNGQGGGIGNSSNGTLTVRNSTFAANSANGQGGGIYNDGWLGLRSSTLAYNWAPGGSGGGIFEDANGFVTLNNVVLAENSGDDYAGYTADPNSFNNLIRFDSGSGLVDTEQGNIIRIDANAGLDPNGLRANGGPTQTIALLPGSDAIGHGLFLPDFPTDQRGVPRPEDLVDIGAYQTLVTISPTTLPNAEAGSFYSTTLSAVGGTGPYTFAFSYGFDDLPPTLTLDADGTLHGTPTLGHTYQFLVSATDADGISGLAVISLEVVPVITPSTDTLLPGSTLLIYGAGFDPFGNNEVQLFSNGVALDPASYYLSGTDPTMLYVNFNTAPTAGVLTAIVTVNGASSAQTPVATAVPAVSENVNDLYANETSLTISGDGFEADPAHWDSNVLTLECSGTPFTAFTITDVTTNSITVSFTAPPIGGTLTAVVTVNGVSSGDPVQVARVVPLVTEDTTLAVLASDTSFVIHGYGFDPNKANDSLYLTGPGVDYTISAATDSTLTVTFNTPPIAGTLTAWVSVNGVDSPYSVQVADVFPVVNVSTAPISVLATSVTITGVGFDPSIPGGSAEVRFSDGSRYWVRQTDITATSITLDIDIGSPLPAGPMTATVEVNGNLSPEVQVATVVPLVTENTDVMPANQTTLIIHGQGFNSDTTHDSVTLTCNGTVLPSSAFSITNATDTSLELTFTSPPIAGVLKAVVTVNGGNAEPVQVATVTPVVTANTDNLPSNASTVTIHGFGFDPTAGNNTVSFSSGSGHVTTATTTQITVTFDTAPLVGPLTATVTVNTLAAPTQTVATVVSPVPVHVDTDFNGDHKADVATYDSTTGRWYVSLSTGTGFTAPQVWATLGPAGGWTTQIYGDFNGDGKTDIANYYAGYGTWWVSLSTGSSFITTYWGQMGPATGWNTLVGDFNGDGKSDLANYYTGSGTMWVSISTGNSFYTTLWGQLGPAAGWTQMVGDFNGDGKSDIANYYNGSGTMWISLSMGNRFSTTLWGQLGPAAGWTHVVGDFNGDGKSDIANYYAATGTLWVSASMGNRFSTSLWAVLTPASGWTRQLVGDFNGDGKADMANYNGNSGTWWVSISTGTAFSTTQWAQLGTSSGWTRQIADDYNGDGLCDIANFFATDGSWWVSRSLGHAFQTTKWL